MAEKKMYVIQSGDDGKFYCGMKYWDKQLRKAQVYHSLRYARDVADAYAECKCKVLEIKMAIVGEVAEDGK